MTAEKQNQEDAFELQMVRQDLLSDTLFLIGTLISINQNNEAEQKIINPDENQPSGLNTATSDNVPFGLGTITLVLFLAGTALLAYTGTERLNKQKAEAGSSPDQTTVNNIKGGEIVIWGQLVRIIGYIISIIGERIRNANPV